MNSALKKIALRLALFLVIFTPLLAAILSIGPKKVFADNCKYSFSPTTVTVGQSVTVTIAEGDASHTFLASFVKDDGSNQGFNQQGRTGTGTISLSSAGLQPGAYLLVVGDADDNNAPPICGLTAGLSSLSISVVAPAGGEAGTADCNTTGRPTTPREAYDRVWLTGICNNNADQVYFNWGQTASIVDSLYSLLWAKSQLHPESDGVTAGTGAIASTGRLVAAMYNPPVSGVNYLAHQFHKLNPVQDAYAQNANGIGYDVLGPVQGVWEAFRNISYVGFVIVFVIIGFAIMFRAKLSSQTIATVQDALPRIVIALVLVTFSYAIAGLMIDVMFLVLNVALNTLPVNDAAKIVFEKSVFGVVTSAWKDTFGAVAESVKDVIDASINFGFIDTILGWFGGTLAALVIGVAMLFIMFKIFLSLLIAYTTIVILTIAAPFFFLFQALPGNNSATSWFKQMAANIAVFPTVAVMFILAGYLGGIGALGSPSPAIQGADVAKFPLLAGDINAAVLGRLAGIGLLLMTPAAADIVKNAIGAKSPGGGAAGAAAAGALSAGAGVVFSGFGAATRQPSKNAAQSADARFGTNPRTDNDADKFSKHPPK